MDLIDRNDLAPEYIKELVHSYTALQKTFDLENSFSWRYQQHAWKHSEIDVLKLPHLRNGISY